ncbi:MAG: SLOG family protein [Acutalibacteraceae bacterium]
MDLNKTAAFIGHSECYGLSEAKIKNAILELIAKGVTVFLNGGQGGFDRLCAKCVFDIKKSYPQIKNYIVIPYLSFKVFNEKYFDSVIYPNNFEKYNFKAAIPARNRYLVDNSGYAICYINHNWGGASKTYERAKKKHLQIINLAE